MISYDKEDMELINGMRSVMRGFDDQAREHVTEYDAERLNRLYDYIRALEDHIDKTHETLDRLFGRPLQRPTMIDLHGRAGGCMTYNRSCGCGCKGCKSKRNTVHCQTRRTDCWVGVYKDEGGVVERPTMGWYTGGRWIS